MWMRGSLEWGRWSESVGLVSVGCGGGRRSVGELDTVVARSFRNVAQSCKLCRWPPSTTNFIVVPFPSLLASLQRFGCVSRLSSIIKERSLYHGMHAIDHELAFLHKFLVGCAWESLNIIKERSSYHGMHTIDHELAYLRKFVY